jgi:hypothetical protein
MPDESTEFAKAVRDFQALRDTVARPFSDREKLREGALLPGHWPSPAKKRHAH